MVVQGECTASAISFLELGCRWARDARCACLRGAQTYLAVLLDTSRNQYKARRTLSWDG